MEDRPFDVFLGLSPFLVLVATEVLHRFPTKNAKILVVTIPRKRDNFLLVSRFSSAVFFFTKGYSAVNFTTHRAVLVERKTRWWFQIFCIFIPTWGDDPN